MFLPFFIFSTIFIKCSQFHLDKIITLPKVSSITTLTNIDDLGLGIVQANVSGINISTISIFSGQNYQQKIKQLNVSQKQLVSPPKFSGFDIMLNFGKNISFDSQQTNKMWKYSYQNLRGKMVTTNKYALIPQELGCPTLIKLDLKTMLTQKIVIQSGSDCVISKYTYLKDLKNGKIMYMSYYSIYFLNNQTLQIQQKIDKSPYLYQSVSSYADQTTNDSTILLSRGAFNQYRILNFDKQTNQYKLNPYIFVINGVNITLTNITSAITIAPSINGIQIRRFNLVSFVSIDFYTANQSLLSRYCQAISKQEDQFVVFSTQNGSLMFYTFNDQFQIGNFRQLKLPSFTSINQAQYTEDSLNLLVINRNKFYRIPLDSSQNYTQEKNDMNCSNLKLIRNGQNGSCNVFISSCITTFNSTKTYFIQLRSAQNLTLLSTYYLNITQNVYDMRLLSNEYWNNYFLLLIKKLNITTSKLMKVENNEIIETQLTSNQFQYSRTEICHQYIVGFKSQVPDDEQFLKIYHFSNFSEVKRYYYKYSKYNFYYDILASGDSLIIQTFDYPYYNTDFYVLSKTPDKWYQGSLQRQYYKQSVKESSSVDYMIFPKRKLYYLHTLSTIGTDYPIKLIYNITNPPIIQKQFLNQSEISQILYINKSESGQRCDYLFMGYKYSSKKFTRWANCNFDKYAQYYQFLQIGYISQPKFFYASTKKHLILLYLSNKYIDIRLIDDPSVRVWYYIAPSKVESVDVIDQGLVIINYDQTLQVRQLISNQFSNNYNLSTISLIDTNKKGQYAFAGVLINQPTMSRIIFKQKINQTAKSTELEGTISLISLNQVGSYLVVSDGSLLNVYMTAGQLKIVLSKNYTFTSKIQFLNESTLLIQQNQAYQILHINQNQTYQGLIQQFYSSIYKIAVSKDGQFIAKAINPYMVQVSNSNQQIIIQFKIPQGNQSPIAQLSFLGNNSLLVATQSGVIYSLIPTPCPDTFINMNGLCVCNNNSTEIQGKCECNHNFVSENNTCICPPQFVFQNDFCVCNNNSTEIQGKCECNHNFVSENNTCICPTSFTYVQNECTCSNYIQNNKCQQCDVFCQTCYGPGLNCNTYKTNFYLVIIGGSLFVVLAITVCILIIRKKGKNISKIQSEQTKDPLVEQ